MKIIVLSEFKYTSGVTRLGYTLSASSKPQEFPEEVAKAAILAGAAIEKENPKNLEKEL